MATRIVFVLIGVSSLAIGIVGIFLPLLPTTPFVLVAAFAFARSSNTLHQWLIEHQVFGTLIVNWRRYGAISRSAKILSVLSMMAILVASWVFGLAGWIIAVQAVVLTGSAVFVLTRPSPPID